MKLESALERVSKYSSLSIRKCTPLIKTTVKSVSLIKINNLNENLPAIKPVDKSNEIEKGNNVANVVPNMKPTTSSTQLLSLTNAEIKNGFKCSICDKTYTNKQTLRRHKYSHLEKKFICKVCSYAFSHQYKLNAHMFRHTGLQEYPCIVCSEKYTQPLSLENHLRKKHSIYN